MKLVSLLHLFVLKTSTMNGVTGGSEEAGKGGEEKRSEEDSAKKKNRKKRKNAEDKFEEISKFIHAICSNKNIFQLLIYI